MDGAPARRSILQGALAALAAPFLSACSSNPGPVGPDGPPLPPLATSPLTGLVAAAGVRWMIVAAPRDLLGVKWIPPLLDVAVSGARFDSFAMATGIDLRTLPEAVAVACAPIASGGDAAPLNTASPGTPPVAPDASAKPDPLPPPESLAPQDPLVGPGDVAGKSPADDDVMLYLARHTGNAQAIERSYRARFTSHEKRSVERPDLVRVSGKIGRHTLAAAFLGADVAAFQDGGSASRGPARIASLFAEGKLKHAHSALAAEPLHSLALRLGAAPFAAYAPGPFEGEVRRGLRGLLGAATAVGAVLQPTERKSFALTAAVTGDFSKSAAPASDELLAAWKDLAGSRLGHMLGLDKPVRAPMTSGAPDAVMIAVELAGQSLAEGLAAATASRVQDIFR
ncbi:MAG: hypothetical protein U0441_14285 [Polyangiaceae bacterium]